MLFTYLLQYTITRDSVNKKFQITIQTADCTADCASNTLNIYITGDGQDPLKTAQYTKLGVAFTAGAAKDISDTDFTGYTVDLSALVDTSKDYILRVWLDKTGTLKPLPSSVATISEVKVRPDATNKVLRLELTGHVLPTSSCYLTLGTTLVSKQTYKGPIAAITVKYENLFTISTPQTAPTDQQAADVIATQMVQITCPIIGQADSVFQYQYKGNQAALPQLAEDSFEQIEPIASTGQWFADKFTISLLNVGTIVQFKAAQISVVIRTKAGAAVPLVYETQTVDIVQMFNQGNVGQLSISNLVLAPKTADLTAVRNLAKVKANYDLFVKVSTATITSLTPEVALATLDQVAFKVTRGVGKFLVTIADTDCVSSCAGSSIKFTVKATAFYTLTVVLEKNSFFIYDGQLALTDAGVTDLKAAILAKTYGAEASLMIGSTTTKIMALPDLLTVTFKFTGSTDQKAVRLELTGTPACSAFVIMMAQGNDLIVSKQTFTSTSSPITITYGNFQKITSTKDLLGEFAEISAYVFFLTFETSLRVSTYCGPSTEQMMTYNGAASAVIASADLYKYILPEATHAYYQINTFTLSFKQVEMVTLTNTLHTLVPIQMVINIKSKDLLKTYSTAVLEVIPTWQYVAGTLLSTEDTVLTVTTSAAELKALLDTEQYTAELKMNMKTDPAKVVTVSNVKIFNLERTIQPNIPVWAIILFFFGGTCVFLGFTTVINLVCKKMGKHTTKRE